MKLFVNNKPHELDGTTIADVLKILGYEGRYFAVALNMLHVPSSQYQTTSIKSGDALEILMPMQGG